MLIWLGAIVCFVGLPVAAYQAAKQLPLGKIFGPVGAVAALTFWALNLERMQKHHEILLKEILALVVLTVAAVVLHAVRSALDKNKHPAKRAAATKPQATMQTVAKKPQESPKAEKKLQIPEQAKVKMLDKFKSVVYEGIRAESADADTNELSDLRLTNEQEKTVIDLITDFYKYWSDIMAAQEIIREYAPDFCVYDGLSPEKAFLSPFTLHSELPDSEPIIEGMDLESFDNDVARMQKDFQMIEACYVNLFELLPIMDNPFTDGCIKADFFELSNQERSDFYDELCSCGLFTIRDIFDVLYSESVNLKSNYLYYKAL